MLQLCDDPHSCSSLCGKCPIISSKASCVPCYDQARYTARLIGTFRPEPANQHERLKVLKFDSHTGHMLDPLSEGGTDKGFIRPHSPQVPQARSPDGRVWSSWSPGLDTVPGHEIDSPVPFGPGEHVCPNCGDVVEPTPTSNPSEPWILYPCCQHECSCCYAFGTLCDNCGKVTDTDNPCCECYCCGSCGAPSDSVCSNCETCESCCDCYACANCGSKSTYGEDMCGDCNQCEGCCSCECDGSCGDPDCCGSGRSDMTPGWITRGWNVPLSGRNAGEDFAATHGKHVDPAQAMSDFYLLDYIKAIMPRNVRHGVNNGLRPATVILRTAEHLQGTMVSILDDAFRSYAFFAIGGEVRHHPSVRNVNPSHGRENMWTYWDDMGKEYGKVPMLEDALALFRDPVWNGGYGGDAWAICTEIVLMREKGEIDDKTFVDRCFALQHNGGSFLDKVAWGHAWDNCARSSVSWMKEIGNAHASEVIGFRTLLQSASNDVKSLLSSIMSDGYLSRLVPDVSIFGGASDRERLASALEDCPPKMTEEQKRTTVAEVPIETITSDGAVQHHSVYEEQCKAEDPKGSGYVCTGPKGHKMAHKAWFGTNQPCDCDPWPNETATSGFQPFTTYVTKSNGSLLTFGESTDTATYKDVHTGHLTPVGEGTEYPEYLTAQHVSDWTVLSANTPKETV
jgi:hypothetical protein